MSDSYYHVYNRGVAKQKIFHDDYDYAVFLNLLKRYLDVESHEDPSGRQYEHLRKSLELQAFYLMPNHFHLLVYLHDIDGLTKLMRGVCTAYTGYYNKKYKRVGTLFQGIFKASRITADNYLVHISRYIHLNPKNYKEWEHSSLSAYLGKQNIPWLQQGKIMDLFEGGVKEYIDFLEDYEDQKAILDEIKYELADR